MSACLSVQSPWMTFTKSYTTRRSQPMMRSRLRRPMSKSMTATFLPRRARPHERLAEVVVLPTPPLPDVTTIISVNAESPMDGSSAYSAEQKLFALEPRLNGLSGEIRGNGFKDAEDACNRHQFRM